jgi:hypothetical protein
MAEFVVDVVSEQVEEVHIKTDVEKAAVKKSIGDELPDFEVKGL